MTTPKRIQRRRTAGWRMPEEAVYVGRPGKWGNPYCPCRRYECNWMAADSPAHAVALYEEAIRLNDAGDRFHRECPTSAAIRAELVGKDLCCWCPEGQPCHADVLLRIANEGVSGG